MKNFGVTTGIPSFVICQYSPPLPPPPHTPPPPEQLWPRDNSLYIPFHKNATALCFSASPRFLVLRDCLALPLLDLNRYCCSFQIPLNNIAQGGGIHGIPPPPPDCIWLRPAHNPTIRSTWSMGSCEVQRVQGPQHVARPTAEPLHRCQVRGSGPPAEFALAF